MSNHDETVKVPLRLLRDLFGEGEVAINARSTLRQLLKKPAMPIVDDAGTIESRRPLRGYVGEKLRCPECPGTVRPSCGVCGGTGFRYVCDRTDCHEHGCSFGTCVPGTRGEILDSDHVRQSQ
jgi:hypothetical protein